MWIVVVNPTSGGGRGRSIGEEVIRLVKERNLKFLEIIENSAHATSLSLKNTLANHPVTGVMAVGGDGLVHLVIQHLANTQIPLLVFPGGTGNDFVRALRAPLDNNAVLLANALSKKPTAIDLGNISGEYFADILSTGFDSIVNERANRMNFVKGPMKYNVAIALELPLFKPREYSFEIDNQRFTTKAMLIAVANGHSYGGGMQVCPDASLTDHLFDIMILKPVSKVHFLRIFPKVFSGKHISDPAVEIRRGKRVSITADAVAYSDGERIGPLPVSAEVAPLALYTWPF